MENPIKIFTSNESFQVEVLKAKLEENGIETYIINKQDSAYVMIGELELYVDASDLDQAKGLMPDQS